MYAEISASFRYGLIGLSLSQPILPKYLSKLTNDSLNWSSGLVSSIVLVFVEEYPGELSISGSILFVKPLFKLLKAVASSPTIPPWDVAPIEIIWANFGSNLEVNLKSLTKPAYPWVRLVSGFVR